MSLKDIASLGKMLAQILGLFADCFRRSAGRALLAVYVRGLLSDVQRKNVEAMVLARGVAVRIQWHVCWRKTRRGGLVSGQATLIVARNVLTGETKYFFSNRVPGQDGWTLRDLLFVAFGRWQVELFFRWLKCFGNFNHLISHSREGVLLHFYVAVIAAMLMYLHTGYRPSKYLFVLLSQVANGAATWDEILPILRERERQRESERQSAARRRAQKKQN